MMTDDLPTIISARRIDGITEINVFAGDGTLLAECEIIPRALLGVDALAKRFVTGDCAIALLPVVP